MPFAIEWSLDNEDWKEAAGVSRREVAGSEYDVSMYACDELLPGRVRFKTDPDSVESFEHEDVVAEWFFAAHRAGPTLDETEFAQGFPVRLLDFALQLVRILSDKDFTENDSAFRDFHDSMGPLRIRFHKSADTMFIYSNYSPGWRVSSTFEEFIGGSRAFLERFTAELSAEAPLLLTWNSVAVLKQMR